MAIKVYIGNDSNFATPLKKIYIGNSDDKARKLKKVYIGDGDNLARLCWSIEGGGGGDTHTHEWIKDENSSYAPTCTQEGENFYYCSCGEVYYDDVPALGHDLVDDCYCTRCKETVHNWSFSGSEDPTCDTDGYELYECVLCHATKTITIDALGHDWEWEFSEDATCTSGGYIEYSCSRCSETKREYTTELGHSWEETGSEGCYTYYRCTRCGDTDTSTSHHFVQDDSSDPNSPWYCINCNEPRGY